MDSPFMGQIQAFAFNFAPRGWAFCQGQTISIQQNNALFALIGTTYGGNGTSNFQLPDLQGRVAIGMGNGAGLSSYVMGQKAGAEHITIGVLNMPSHTHIFTPNGAGGVVKASSKVGTQPAPSATVNTLGAAVDPSGNNSTNNLYNNQAPDITLNIGAASGGAGTNSLTGGSQPVGSLPPYLAINYCIALLGIFPTRN